MRIKVQLAPHPRLLATRTGDTLGGLPIAYTHEGDPHTILTTPPDWTETTVEAWARALAVQGLLVDDGELWRPEKEPGILWLPGSQDADILWEFADTCPGIGVDADTRGRGRLGAGIKVAILDTGVHGAHEYWARLVAEGRLLGDLTDEVGHGTHCAGIILMIAPGIILRSWKVLPNGSGPEGLIAAGIDAAVAWGARIITMSLGGVGPSAILRGAVGRARAAGVLVASAAGNGSSAQPIGSPADASTWAVCAYNRSDPPGWASFSDGRYPTDRSLPRVIDPGLDVVSTVPGGYRANSGTSMACPHRAGIAALLLGSGLDAPAVERYVASHAGWAPDGLASPLRPDFGVVEGPLPEPPPEEADGAAAIRARTQELRDRVVAIQLDRCAWCRSAITTRGRSTTSRIRSTRPCPQKWSRRRASRRPARRPRPAPSAASTGRIAATGSPWTPTRGGHRTRSPGGRTTGSSCARPRTGRSSSTSSGRRSPRRPGRPWRRTAACPSTSTRRTIRPSGRAGAAGPRRSRR
jgi:hypothetical protein